VLNEEICYKIISLLWVLLASSNAVYFAFLQFQNGYQQAAQNYYSSPTVPYASNYGYPAYADNGALLNGASYGLNQYSSLPNSQMGGHQQTVPESAEVQPANLLATLLQNKG